MKQHKTAGCERLETARQLFQIVAVFDINISECKVWWDFWWSLYYKFTAECSIKNFENR